MPRIETPADPSPAALESIVAPLDRFSRDRGFAWHPETAGIVFLAVALPYVLTIRRRFGLGILS